MVGRGPSKRLDFSRELVEGGRAGYRREGRGLPGAQDHRRRDPEGRAAGGVWLSQGNVDKCWLPLLLELGQAGN